MHKKDIAGSKIRAFCIAVSLVLMVIDCTCIATQFAVSYLWIIRYMYIPLYVIAAYITMQKLIDDGRRLSLEKIRARKEKIRNQWIADYESFRREMHGVVNEEQGSRRAGSTH